MRAVVVKGGCPFLYSSNFVIARRKGLLTFVKAVVAAEVVEAVEVEAHLGSLLWTRPKVTMA